MERRLWIAAAVWVVFWSLYPTFGRPRAFAAAIRAGGQAQEYCDGHPGAGQEECYLKGEQLLQEKLAPITLRHEYSGYAPVWLGAGLGVPLAMGWLLVAGATRRRPRLS